MLAVLGWVGLRVAEKWLASTTFFRDTLREEIAKRFDGDVAVSSAVFHALTRVVEANDLVLKDRRAGEPQIVIPSVSVKLPYSIVDSSGRIVPERVLVKGGIVRLVERSDGSFAPLDLIRVVQTGIPIPAVAIEDGTVVLSGDGALNALLDGIVKKELPRRVEKVRLASAPMPETSDYLVGFNGNLVLPGLAPVTLFGGIGRDNSMRLELELRDLDLSSKALRETLAPALVETLERHVLGGKVTVEVELGLSAVRGAEARIRIHLHVRDLVLRHPTYFSRDLSGISLEASFDGVNFRIHDLKIPDRGGELAIDGVIEHVIGDDALDFRDFRFTARGADLAFQDSLVSDLTEPMIRHIIDDYAPQGRAEFFLELSRTAGGKVRPRWSLKPKHASGSYVGHVRADGTKVGFPYRVTDLIGEVSGDGPYVEIRHLRGRHAGLGLVEIDGSVDASGAVPLLELRVRAAEIPLADGKLRDALEYVSEGAGSIVDRFHPTGTIDADVRVWVDPATFVTHREGRVIARSLDARVDDFPFPLHFEKGSVSFTDTTYTIDALEAKAGTMEVGIDGRVWVIEHQVGIEVSIDARNARAQDPVLRRAVNDMLARVKGEGPPPFEWSWLEPAGGFDAAVELRQEPGDSMRFSALLFPRDLKAVPKWFAIPIEGVAGRIEFGTLDPDTFAPRPMEIELDGLRGRYRDSQLAISGQVDERGLAALEVRGSRVPITADFLAAVVSTTNAADTTSDESTEEAVADGLVHALEPGGRASLHFSSRRRNDVLGSRLELDVRGAAMRATGVPGGGIRDVDGRWMVDLQQGIATGEGLRGRFDGLDATARASRVELRTNADSIALDGDFALTDLPLDERAAAWLPAPLDTEFVSTSGLASLSARDVSVVVDVKSEATRVRMREVEASIADANPTEPVAIEGLGARLRVPELTYSKVGDHRQITFGARIDSLNGRVGGLGIESVSADLDVSPRGMRADGIAGRIAEGSLDPARSALSIVSNEGLRGGLVLTDGDLTTLLAQIGVPSVGTRGRFDVELNLEGKDPTLAALGGSGVVRIRDGRLADIPWIAAIYRRTLGYVFGEWLEPTFSSGEIVFERASDRIKLSHIRLDSMVPNVPVGLRLTGDGELGSTGIDLRIVPEILRTDDRLILAPLLRAITRPLFSYRVTGSLGNPRVSYRNVAMEFLLPMQDDTNRPRLVEPRKPDWSGRF